MEDSSLPEGETLIDNVVAFCDGVREAGYCCGVYSFLYWMVTRLNSPRLDKYLKWVAQWNSTLDYDKPVALWQYTDSGVLLGKKFDMNKAYVDLPGLCGRKEEPVDREEAAAIAREEASRSTGKTRTSIRPSPTCQSGPGPAPSGCIQPWASPARETPKT